MASLYKRAVPSQIRVLRAIEGAIKNANDAHPQSTVTAKMARSIVKRATGTLTADWPDVLAARLPRRSKRTFDHILSDLRPQGAHPAKQLGNRGMSGLARHPPLRQILSLLSGLIAEAKGTGDSQRRDDLIVITRLVAVLWAQETASDAG